jgi:DNA-binding YbaB/EbfC family protein
MMKGGLGNILKQAQEMQSNLQKAQAELEQMEVNGESGGGMVKLTMNGRHDARRLEIDASLMGEGADKEMLEDLIVAAVNDAVHKVEKQSKEKMSDMMGGLNLPEGMKMPF